MSRVIFEVDTEVREGVYDIQIREKNNKKLSVNDVEKAVKILSHMLQGDVNSVSINTEKEVFGDE